MTVTSSPPRRSASAPTVDGGRALALAAVCIATLAITVDTTIMNITLPTLVRDMGAQTRDLQWIVDAYNISFAALVLAAGCLGDRYGRRNALVAGLATFAFASALGSQASSVGELVIARVAMGVGAAFVFPSTLSIISNLFVDRVSRSKAIGVWGATGGLGVALGPITGGWLLNHFWWGVSFLAMVPVAAVAIVLALRVIPPSRDPGAPRVDLPGLVLSSVAIGVLVWAIIEAPSAGWASRTTTAAATVVVVIGAIFVRHELRTREPMLDVQLFRNLRFTAASGSVAIAYFALFGFIFLITQYFQLVLEHSPLEAGVRQVPVAIAVVLGSLTGVRLAVHVGNNRTIAAGLTMLALAFAWASTASPVTPYVEIAAQMLLIGVGMGFTSAPATEAIMGAVPKAKAGIGSAVNDATRELGGTLGVAVVGSVFASLYAAAVSSIEHLPAAATTAIRGSYGAAAAVAARFAEAGDHDLAGRVVAGAEAGFFDGFQLGCLVAAAVALGGAVLAGFVLPAHPLQDEADDLDGRSGR